MVGEYMRFYIDPGTGSMLFTILIGVLGTVIYALKMGLVKLRFIFSAGKKEKSIQNKKSLVIFAESKRYWNTFESICDELEKRQQECTYYTCSNDDPIFEKDYKFVKPEFIGTGNKPFALLNVLEADVLLATTPGLDVYQWKRSKSVKCYVHIPHMANDMTLYRVFGLDYYDAIFHSGEYHVRQIKALEEQRNLPSKEFALVGIPYLDALKKRLEESPEQDGHATTVILAPSWGPSSILSRYGEKMISSLLETKYHIIIRPHPQSFQSETKMLNSLMEKFPESEQLEWNRDSDNFEVLRRSDVLISDFSGVVFDFSLVFDKPFIYADTSFDDSPYDSHWLSEKPWTFTVLPKIGHQLVENDLPHLKEIIDSCINDPSFSHEREKAREDTWANIGNSATLIADWLQNKLTELNKD